MSDEFGTVPTPEPAQVSGYPRSAYLALLIILAVLMVSIAAFRLLPSHQAGPPATDQEVLQGNLYIKFYYVLQYYLPSDARTSPFNSLLYGKTKNGKVSQPGDLRQMAAQQYDLAAKKDPSAYNIRRLIIVESPERRSSAIDRFVLASKNALEGETRDYRPEMHVWRTIYLSKEKLSPADVKLNESKIHAMGLGWYEKLALAELYDRAGMKANASAERRSAAEAAAAVVFPIAFMVIGFMLVLVAGIALDSYYLKKKQAGWPGARSDILELPDAERSRASGYLLESFVVYILVFVFVQIVFMVIEHVGIRRGWLFPNSLNLIALEAAQYLLWGLLSLAFLRYRLREIGWSLSNLGLRSFSIWRDISWGLAGYIGAVPILFAAALISLGLTERFHTPPNPAETLLVGNESWVARLLLLFLLSVAAPFFEELFFRGVLFNSLRSRWSFPAAVLVSAAVFAGVHPLPFGFLPIMALGAVFAVLTYQRGSLIPNMIAHCLWNGMVFVFVTLIST
jgi:hypothetical protein